MAPSFRLARRFLRSDGASRVLAVLLALFAPSVAFAWQANGNVNGTCYESGDVATGTVNVWSATHDAACAAAITRLNASQSTYTWSTKSCSQYYNGAYYTGHNKSRVVRATGAKASDQWAYLIKRVAPDQAGCKIASQPPPTNYCASYKGKFKNIVEPTTANLGKTSCIAGCEFKSANFAIKRTDGQYQWRTQVTGEECGGSGSTAPTDTDGSNETCATTAGGATFCAPHDKKNCGYYNNEYVCVGSSGPDKCIDTASGKRFCPDTAPTPPTPNNGTPGSKATPNDTFNTVSNEATAPGGADSSTPPIERVHNVYTPQQVAGSSRDPGGSGATGNTPGVGGGIVGGGSDSPSSGSGNGDGEGEGDGAASSCSGPECDYTPPEMPEVDSFEETSTGAWSTLQQAPIVAAMASISTTWPSGSCPMGSINLGEFGGTQDLGGMACGLWAENIAPVLSVIMLAFWSFLGLRIIFEA